MQKQRNLHCRSDVHFNAQGTHGGHQSDNPVEVFLGGFVNQFFMVRPRRFNQQLRTAVGRFSPQFLRNVRHERMQQNQNLIQHPSRRRARFRFQRFVLSVQKRFGEFQIPVAIRSPSKLIDA